MKNYNRAVTWSKSYFRTEITYITVKIPVSNATNYSLN